jgi:hypothetical protein
MTEHLWTISLIQYECWYNAHKCVIPGTLKSAHPVGPAIVHRWFQETAYGTIAGGFSALLDKEVTLWQTVRYTITCKS